MNVPITINNLITISNGIAVLDAETASKIAEYERTIKRAEAAEKTLREAIFKAMEDSGIIKLDSDELTINYIAATDKETFDKKAFRKDHPDMYDEYISMSPVKASIRINLKEQADE